MLYLELSKGQNGQDVQAISITLSWNKPGATWQKFQACSAEHCYEVATSVHHLWIELFEQNFDLYGCGAAASPSCGC